MASTGFVLAGAGASVDRAGSTAWTTPGNVTADDAATASAVVPTDYLVCSSFDFSSIPAGATIKGVTVRVQAHETGTSGSNYVPQLISATTPTLIGTAKSAVAVSGTTPTNSDSGSSSDVWSATLTSAVVKAAGFGVAIWSTDTVNTLLIDAVWISVEYQVNAGPGAASVPLLTAAGAGVVTTTATLGTGADKGGFFYNLPPPRIGGRQPYTRRDWIPPAVPPPQVPPRTTRALFGIILTAWLPQTYQLPPQVKIAPLIQGVTHVGSGSASLLSLTASGAGERIGKGTGAASVPVVMASGIGRRTLRSVGAPILPLQTATGAATKVSKGSGALSLPLLSASGATVSVQGTRPAIKPSAFGVILSTWRTSYDLPPLVKIAPLLPIAPIGPVAAPLLAPSIFGILSHWRAEQDRPPQVRIAPVLPVPEAPPVRTWANFGVIRGHWVPPPYELPKQVQIAPLVPVPSDPVGGGPVLSRVTFGVIVSTWHPQRVPRNTSLAYEEPPTPPPLINRGQFQIIGAVWREDPVVVISMASSAPLLVAPPDKPMQDRRQFDLIVRAWEFTHPRQREKKAAQFPVVDPPPVSSPPADRRTQEIIRRAWEPGPPRQREQKPEIFPRVDAAPLIDRRQHALINRAWEPYHPRQREKSSALFPRVDVAPLKLRTNIDTAIQQWVHVHPLLQQRKLPPPSGAPDPAQPYAGKTSKGVGIYRKDWNYARPKPDAYRAPLDVSLDISTATLSFSALPWSITGTPVSSMGLSSLAPIRRTGVYRKTWNYAERNAIPDIFWFEQFPTQSVELTRATLSFTAQTWSISTTVDYIVTLSRPTLTFTPLPWTIVAIEDYLETFTTAVISFNALPWSINTIGEDVVELTTPTITFEPLQWTLVGATAVTNMSLARVIFQALPWEIVGDVPIPPIIDRIDFGAAPNLEIIFSAAPELPTMRILFSGG